MKKILNIGILIFMIMLFSGIVSAAGPHQTSEIQLVLTPQIQRVLMEEDVILIYWDIGVYHVIVVMFVFIIKKSIKFGKVINGEQVW